MAGIDESEERFRRAFVLLLLLAVLAVFFYMVRSLLIAVLFAAIFTALLYPAQVRLCRAIGGHNRLSAALVLIAATVVIGIPLLVVLGLVTREAMQISENAGEWVKTQLEEGAPLAATLPEWLPFREMIDVRRGDVLERAGQAIGAAGTFLVSSIPDITRGTFQFFLSIFVMFYAMFWFLADGSKLLAAAKHYLPLHDDDRDYIVRRGFSVARASLKSILVVGVLEGVLMALAFWVVGIQGAAFWGLLVVILAALPGLGAPLVWIPAALYLFVTGETIWGIAMLLWGVVIIGGIDNILRPIIVGRDARVSDLLMLIATLGGITLFGIAGIIVGPIIAAVVITALDIYQRAFATALPEVKD